MIRFFLTLFLVLAGSTAYGLDMVVYPKFQALSNAGAPLSGGLLYSYEPGTTTPKATYADKNGAAANPNPVVLSARGEASVYVSGATKLVLKTSTGSTIWTNDNTSGIGEADTRVSTVSTIAALRLLTGSTGVSDINLLGYYSAGDGGSGPTRHWVSGALPGTYTDNGGSVIVPTGGDGSEAWTFSIDPTGAKIVDFGSKCDGSTDDTTAISSANTASDDIVFPVGRTCVVSSITFDADTIITLNGSVLKSTDNSIIVGDNTTIDLGGGSLYGNLRKAKVSVQAALGATEITVADASELAPMIGISGNLRCSYAGTDSTTYTITGIVGNVVTVTPGLVDLIPVNAYIGNFAFTELLDLSGSDNVTIKNGSIENTYGYSMILDTSTNVVVQDMTLKNAGFDLLNIISSTAVFNNVTFGNIYDYAKQAAVVQGTNTDVKFNYCNFQKNSTDVDIWLKTHTTGGVNDTLAMKVECNNCVFDGSNDKPANSGVGLYGDAWTSIDLGFTDVASTMEYLHVNSSTFKNTAQYSIGTPVSSTAASYGVIKLNNNVFDNEYFLRINDGSATSITSVGDKFLFASHAPSSGFLRLENNKIDMFDGIFPDSISDYSWLSASQELRVMNLFNPRFLTDTETTAITNDSVTMTATSSNIYYITDGTAAHISTIAGGYTGQTILLVFNDALVDMYFDGSGNLKGNIGANWTAIAAGDALRCTRSEYNAGYNWYCIPIDTTP